MTSDCSARLAASGSRPTRSEHLVDQRGSLFAHVGKMPFVRSWIPPRWINHSAHGFVSHNVSATNCTSQLVLLSVSSGLMFESGAAMHGITATQHARSP
jgi:hypothetical protein